jgi:hypothetical protein
MSSVCGKSCDGSSPVPAFGDRYELGIKEKKNEFVARNITGKWCALVIGLSYVGRVKMKKKRKNENDNITRIKKYKNVKYTNVNDVEPRYYSAADNVCTRDS